MSLAPRRSIVGLALVVLSATSCAAFENLPRLKPNDLGFKLAQSSKIYDGKGKLITTFHKDEDRTIVAFEIIPKHLKDAVVAIEDERFYKHDGVDLKAIVRAALANISSGEIKEGGSTITQQYVKNYIIAPGETAARTFQRKLDEAALSRQLEKRLTKNDILWRYLNTVYFGNGAYGVQAAAKTYFGKSVRNINLREAATIAGLIRSPETYDPFDRRRLALDRRNTVLNKMTELGWATRAAVDRAKRQRLGLQPRSDVDSYAAPYFIDYVQRLIKFDPRFNKALGNTVDLREQALFQGGLKVYTTIDPQMQAAAEDAIDSVLTEPGDPHGSLVAVDPESGYVKAMVGGRDWFVPRRKDRFAKLNLAVQAEPNLDCERRRRNNECRAPLDPRTAPGTGRQAGSAFKPFALAAALEQGASLSEIYRAGQCIQLPGMDNGATWDPCNYEESNFGRVSLLEATVNSVNVVFAQLIVNGEPIDRPGETPGYCKLCEPSVDLAHEMGIRTDLQPTPSLVLGSNPVNPLGMASAYGTFATNGEHNPPVAITKITTADGKVLYRDRSRGEQVLEPGAAYLTTTALEPVVQRGTGVNAQIGRPAAGKTGTAQDYRDAWFGGYTPDLAAAAWVGYPEGSVAMRSSCAGIRPPCRSTRIGNVTGGSWPAMIWGRFMQRALSGIPPRDFDKPAIDLTTVVIDTRNGCLADRFTPHEYRAEATFLAGTEPDESCREEDQLLRIPDLIGFPVDDARRILTGAGFGVEVARQPTTTYPPGRVIDHDPGPGDTAPLGSTITLVVSSNANEVERATVPNVLGMSRSAAEAHLRNEGFDVRTIVESEGGKGAKKRKGRVWKQDPAGGSEADYGSTVTIWVNPG